MENLVDKYKKDLNAKQVRNKFKPYSPPAQKVKYDALQYFNFAVTANGGFFQFGMTLRALTLDAAYAKAKEYLTRQNFPAPGEPAKPEAIRPADLAPTIPGPNDYEIELGRIDPRLIIKTRISTKQARGFCLKPLFTGHYYGTDILEAQRVALEIAEEVMPRFIVWNIQTSRSTKQTDYEGEGMQRGRVHKEIASPYNPGFNPYTSTDWLKDGPGRHKTYAGRTFRLLDDLGK